VIPEPGSHIQSMSKSACRKVRIHLVLKSPMLRLARAALQRLLPPGRQGATDLVATPTKPRSVAATPLGRDLLVESPDHVIAVRSSNRQR